VIRHFGAFEAQVRPDSLPGKQGVVDRPSGSWKAQGRHLSCNWLWRKTGATWPAKYHIAPARNRRCSRDLKSARPDARRCLLRRTTNRWASCRCR